MSPLQILRILWARKWVSLLIFSVIAGIGIAASLQLPKRYYAQTSVLVDIRPDPLLGQFGMPFNMSAQLELIQSDLVAVRAAEVLGVKDEPEFVDGWRASGSRWPVELFWARILVKDLLVESSRGGTQIRIGYTHEDPAFAARVANAFAQAAVDASREMRSEPARDSAGWVEQRAAALRQDLEQAQANLTAYQREKGIVGTEDRLNQEVTRLSILQAQLAAAEAERSEAVSRQRAATRGDRSPDVQQSAQVGVIRGQLSAAETRLSEISSVVGVNHPQRRQLEAQIAQLREQLEQEIARVSSATATVSQVSNQKVQELRALVEAQNRRLLSLRSDYDRIALLQRDVEAAQRAYDNLVQRGSQVALQSQVDQSLLRPMTPAVQPSFPSRKRMLAGILLSLGIGFVLGVGIPFGLELLDRRVRGVEDLLGAHGVPVIAVLHPRGSRKRTVRRFPVMPPAVPPALPSSGSWQ